MPEQRRALLQSQAQIAAAQLEATRTQQQAAARTSWITWADDAVDARAAAAHAYSRRSDEKLEDDSVRSYHVEIAVQHADWQPRWMPLAAPCNPRPGHIPDQGRMGRGGQCGPARRCVGGVAHLV